MDQSLIYDFCAFVGAIPFLTIVGRLLHYVIRRARFNHERKSRKSLPGFFPSSAALGVVFLLSSMLFRPRLQYAIEAQQVVATDEDDDGGPDPPGTLDKQLKRLRRGERIDRLILRL